MYTRNDEWKPYCVWEGESESSARETLREWKAQLLTAGRQRLQQDGVVSWCGQNLERIGEAVSKFYAFQLNVASWVLAAFFGLICNLMVNLLFAFIFIGPLEEIHFYLILGSVIVLILLFFIALRLFSQAQFQFVCRMENIARISVTRVDSDFSVEYNRAVKVSVESEIYDTIMRVCFNLDISLEKAITPLYNSDDDLYGFQIVFWASMKWRYMMFLAILRSCKKIRKDLMDFFNSRELIRSLLSLSTIGRRTFSRQEVDQFAIGNREKLTRESMRILTQSAPPIVQANV